MARGRKAAKPAAAAKLMEALAFVRIAQPTTADDVPYKHHAAMWNNWLLASNGVISAGHPIDEDLVCCPHTTKFHSAIAQSKKELSITQLENTDLLVKADKFAARVPCIKFDDIPPIIPDQSVGYIDDRVKVGFNTIGALAVDTSQFVITASVLLRAGSMVTTDRKMMFEYWHGLNLPTLVIPKAFVTAIGKVEKELASFGFSDNSATFYFQDGSWLKTQLYNEAWPETVDQILNNDVMDTHEIPKGFFEAVAAVTPFATNDHSFVYIDGEKIKSTKDAEIGASYDCKVPVPDGGEVSFNGKSLMMLEKRATRIAFNNTRGSLAYFIGDNFRGVLMGQVVKSDDRPAATEQPQQHDNTTFNNDEPLNTAINEHIHGTPIDDDVPF